jgi:hypothetical protein
MKMYGREEVQLYAFFGKTAPGMDQIGDWVSPITSLDMVVSKKKIPHLSEF